MTNNSKRGWLPQEDQLLLQLVAAAGNEKLKWVEVAKVLHENIGRARTGKQCRQRWQHQLNPSIVRDEWTDSEQMKLFELQAEYGNKWAQIAQLLPGRTDNAVKNFFYSAVRRVFTKVNMYLGRQRNVKEFKSIREFETDFLSKLMAVVDGNYLKKIRLTSDEAILTAKNILANVAVLSTTSEEMGNEQLAELRLVEMVRLMHDFRKSCKKRKQRKHQLDKDDLIEESEDEQTSSKSSEPYSSEHSSKNERSSKKNKLAETQEMKDEKEEAGFGFLKQMKFLSSRVISGEEINTTKSIEFTESTVTTPEPALFRTFSGMDERRNDKWWEVLNVNGGVMSSYKMEEEMGNWEWREDCFSLGNQREDLFGSSQTYGANQTVTKFKMLEASIALEDLLLNSKKSSRIEQYPQFL